MPPKVKRPSKVDVLVNRGGEQRASKSGSVLLKAGKQSITLVKANGQVTRAGKQFEQRGGTILSNSNSFANSKPYREGNTEYLNTTGGKKRILRRFDPASGDFEFSKLGLSYYSTMKRNYVVQVPITISGKRANGSTYTVQSFMTSAVACKLNHSTEEGEDQGQCVAADF